MSIFNDIFGKNALPLSNHCYNAIPYLGKEGNVPAVNIGANMVKKLVEPIRATNTFEVLSFSNNFMWTNLLQLGPYNPIERISTNSR